MLAVDLLLEAGIPVNDREAFLSYVAPDIPTEALLFFQRNLGNGRPAPTAYMPYEKAFYTQFDVIGIRGTPLMLAALFGQLETCEKLLKHGADVNIEAENRPPSPYGTVVWRETALTLAIKKIQPEIVRLLIESGAQVYSLEDVKWEQHTISRAFLSAEQKTYKEAEKERRLMQIAEMLDDVGGRFNGVRYSDVLSEYLH